MQAVDDVHDPRILAEGKLSQTGQKEWKGILCGKNEFHRWQEARHNLFPSLSRIRNLNRP